MNARDRVRLAIHKIGIGVPIRANALPEIHNIHDILSSLYQNDELDLISCEEHVRGHQKYERRVYAGNENLKEVEADDMAEKWDVSGWAKARPELFADPNIPGVLRVVTFGDQE